MNKSSENQITDKKSIRTGLSLYKTGRSPYWFAQIWVGAEKKYYRKSTKETSRIDAAKVAEEIFESLKNQKVILQMIFYQITGTKNFENYQLKKQIST